MSPRTRLPDTPPNSSGKRAASGATATPLPSCRSPSARSEPPASPLTRAAERGLLTNLVEFPALPVGRSRFRMQVMARHTAEQAARAATLIADTLAETEPAAPQARTYSPA